MTTRSPPLGLSWCVRPCRHHAGALGAGRAWSSPEWGLWIALATNASAMPGNILEPSADFAEDAGA